LLFAFFTRPRLGVGKNRIASLSGKFAYKQVFLYKLVAGNPEFTVF